MKTVCNNEVEVFGNKNDDGRVFDYALNKKKAKAKLLKGAKRENLDVEIKNGCVNLLFSDGAYFVLVLPLMRLWNRKVNEVFIVNETEIKVIEIDTGIEETGNHVDTKIVIMANNQRFVLHAYNGTQNLMVQGKNYEQFAVNCLRPFFLKKIQESLDDINKYNINIKEVLSVKPLKANKQFKCPQCESIATTNTELKAHMKTCHTKPGISPPRYKVPKILNENISLVDISTKEDEKLDPEIRLPLIEDAPFCNFCDFDPTDQKELEEHMKIIHFYVITEENEINHQVGQNFIMNQEDQSQKESIKSSTPKKDYAGVIDDAAETFNTSKMNKRAIFDCDECNELLNSQEEVEEHLKKKHKIMNIYNCTSCEFKTPVMEEFKKHVEIMHVIEKDNIKCEICNVEVATLEELERHKSSYHILLRFKCGICDIVFTSIDNLKEHQKTKHEVSESKEKKMMKYYYCDSCEFKSNTLLEIQEHKKTTHDMPEYKCDSCDLVSRSIEELWIHKITVHEGYQALTPEGTQGMQQTLLLRLSGMLEYLVENMSKLKAETKEGFKESRIKMEVMEEKLKKIDDNLIDTKVAMAKTARFDEKLQNDGIAVLRNFSDKCSSLENIILDKKTKVDGVEIAHEKEEVNSKSSVNKAEIKKTSTEGSMSQKKQKHKVAWVGTSISKVLNKKKVEEDLNVELKAVKAYCVENEGRYPAHNFKEAVPEALNAGDVDTLVIEAGNIEITNIDVNKAVMDTENSIEDYKKEWFDKAEETSKALFKIAEDCVIKDEKLNVVIVKRLQRFDKPSSDIIGIKQRISQYANKIYDQCILKSNHSSRIHVIEFNLTQNSDYLKEIIYGQTENPRYDGIHLSGSESSRHFSYRAVQALKLILHTRSQSKMRPSHHSRGQSESFEQQERNSESHGHTNCPQAQYQRIQRGNRAHKSRHYESYASVVKSNTWGGQTYNSSIPTRNRFDQLSSQGNW